ncbi:MAG: polysaccharide biosynthesis/export family protein [Flavobacteriales bacterium]|nr:polysaccharide biosynthesis/export family protein [Flavobacteriales bacterium]
MQRLLLCTSFGIIILASGCRVFQPGVMLRTPKDFDFSEFPDTIDYEYKIHANDLLEFRLFANDGFVLIDVTESNAANNNFITQNRASIQYRVEQDGMVKLPVISRVQLEGMTIIEAERFLEDKYAKFYKKPFVQIRVVNQRVIVFPGSEGDARVIQLLNRNTTLLEALALSGGISERGKARRVKLIRGTGDTQKIFLLDLATIDGIDKANMVLQANDIIYVEPVFSPTREVLAELAPLISLITSSIAMVLVIRSLNQQ